MPDLLEMHRYMTGKKHAHLSRALESSRVPGDSGSSVIGHTFYFLRRTQPLMDELRALHGPNFRMDVFGRPVLIIGSPDAVREVLLDRDKNFSSERGWKKSIGKLFARGLILKDFDEHRGDRRLMQMAFRNEAMRGYVDTMTAHTRTEIVNWPRELKLYPALKQLTLDMASSIFLGLALGPDSKVVNDAFVAAVSASIAVVRSELPVFAYGRGMRGRRTLEQFFATLIRRRREDPGTDLLSELCRAKSEDGERFSDRAITDHMIFLMMAAHDTTTSSLSSLVHLLLEHPEWQERVREEVRARGTASLDWDDRAALPVLDRCFDETLRLFPAVPFTARQSLRECTLAGFEIPADMPIAPASLVTHRLPEFWSSPDRFDPDRFSPERAEHTKHSHLYYPFGGGAHVCIGLHFARIQVKAVMSELLGRYRLVDPRRAPGPRSFASVPIPYPRDGLPVVLERL
jgi:cytochrome P450